jgi:hypothetical protein
MGMPPSQTLVTTCDEEDYIMAYSKQPSSFDAASSTVAHSRWIPSFSQHVTAWAGTAAAYHTAAALYDELRGLSDAELARRGLSRATLARDVCRVSESRTP